MTVHTLRTEVAYPELDIEAGTLLIVRQVDEAPEGAVVVAEYDDGLTVERAPGGGVVRGRVLQTYRDLT